MRYKDPLKQILEQTRWYWDHDGVPPHVRAAFRKVLECRTAALGAEVFASENGELIVYHTCKSRACPSCGNWATIKWIRERLVTLPPVLYKGITFSMPKVLWRLFHANRSLADALPAFAAGAIEALILARHGLRAGVIAILHTFNGLLEFNSHVHTMVTAGGLQASSGSWLASVYYDNDLLMKLWQSAVLELLRTAHHAGVLRTDMTSNELEAMLLEQERWWSVKIQSFNSTEHFLQYAGRYARRPPIAQRRIVEVEKRSVTFWAKDKKSKRLVAVECSPEEFIDRWIQHLLKRYQHAVRYFGLFAPRVVRQMFDLVFAAIGQNRQPRQTPPRWADSRKQMSGQDPLLDPTGLRRIWVRQLAPQAAN
jgi:hypothetical protein